MKLSVEIPDEISPKKNASRKLLEAFVLYIYNSGKISSGKVAELLGFSRYQADGFLKKHSVAKSMPVSELISDLKTIRRTAK